MTVPKVDDTPETPQDGPFPRVAPRDENVFGAVTATERTDILAALAAAGFRSQSEGVRSVLLAFEKDPEVQRAVETAVRELRIV